MVFHTKNQHFLTHKFNKNGQKCDFGIDSKCDNQYIISLFFYSRLKSELAMLRKRGLLTNGHHHHHHQHHPGHHHPSHHPPGGHPQNNNTNLNMGFASNLSSFWASDPNRSCGRCRSELGRIMNRGAFCRACNVRVCKSCREYGIGRNGASDWLCTICYKSR